MASSTDNRDPIHKLEELLAWLANNRIHTSTPRSSAALQPSAPLHPHAQQEVQDFKDWLKEIQNNNIESPKRSENH